MTTRWAMAFLAAVIVVPVTRADDTAEELKKLQGTWQVVKGFTGGREVPKEVADDSKFTFEGEVLSFESSRDKNTAKIKIELTKSPRTLDAEVIDGADAGKKRLAIYELAGDTLKICWTRGENRPEKLDGSRNDVIYVELKRAK